MPYAIVNKIRMHYEVTGAGPPLLLISGLSAPSVGWALQVKALAPHFQVVTFDNRGVGATDLPPEPVYTTAQMADDAAAVLRHLNISRAHVLGASMGGTIALELALRHARLVRSLILACTWAEADARFLHTVEAWISLAYRVPIEERLRHVVYPWLFSPAFFTAKENVETAFQRAMALVGADDILTPPAFARALARTLPRARLSVLPGGHGFFLEHAELFNRT